MILELAVWRSIPFTLLMLDVNLSQRPQGYIRWKGLGMQSRPLPERSFRRIPSGSFIAHPLLSWLHRCQSLDYLVAV